MFSIVSTAARGGRRARRNMAIVAATVLATASVGLLAPASAQEPVTTEPAPVTEPLPPADSCVSFASDADGTQWPPQFMRDGYSFEALGGGYDPFSNSADGMTGLFHDDDGLRVGLPGPATIVTVLAASFNAEVTLSAIDPTGAIVDQVMYEPGIGYDEYALSGADIVELEFLGGGGENVIVRICSES